MKSGKATAAQPLSIEIAPSSAKQHHSARSVELERTGDSIKFNLNDGEYLCGEVTLHIDDVKGKYLYLYNNVKHKYELVSTEDMSGLNLSTPGKYMITAKPIREGSAAVRYILIAGGIGIIAGIAVYVAVKRRYWFW